MRHIYPHNKKLQLAASWLCIEAGGKNYPGSIWGWQNLFCYKVAGYIAFSDLNRFVLSVSPDFSFSLSLSQACYGILKVPQGNWLCRTCALGVQPKCLLCPKRGGALKPTRSGTKWVHVSCALWIPEVRPKERHSQCGVDYCSTFLFLSCKSSVGLCVFLLFSFILFFTFLVIGLGRDSSTDRPVDTSLASNCHHLVGTLGCFCLWSQSHSAFRNLAILWLHLMPLRMEKLASPRFHFYLWLEYWSKVALECESLLLECMQLQSLSKWV